MARADDDTWATTEGVGATTLGVAIARASESARADLLFVDPYARYFLEARWECSLAYWELLLAVSRHRSPSGN